MLRGTSECPTPSRTVRVTLNDGAVSYGAEAMRYDDMFPLRSGLTHDDVAKIEWLNAGTVADGAWTEASVRP